LPSAARFVDSRANPIEGLGQVPRRGDSLEVFDQLAAEGRPARFDG